MCCLTRGAVEHPAVGQIMQRQHDMVKGCLFHLFFSFL